MPRSIRLKPDIERLLREACRRTRKSRSALIHEALTEYLCRKRPNVGDLFEELLKEFPQGVGIERRQPATWYERDWPR